jgi:hypothetical protein
MDALTEIPHDVRENQVHRDALLAQPAEYFTDYCGGRVPDLAERLILIERLVQSACAPQVFINDLYRVQVRRDGPMMHLTIARWDGKPCKDWRHFQQIKNQIAGRECEAVELFPAESRLVDMDHEYHLWVNADPRFRFPFGYSRRRVQDQPLMFRGNVGEPLPDGVGPTLVVDHAGGHVA